jgi:hypothetical protein
MIGTPEFELRPDTPFGRSITAAEFFELCRTGRLEGALLERFWRMSDFHSPMPEYIEIMVSKSGVDKLIREIRREGKIPKKRRGL